MKKLIIFVVASFILGLSIQAQVVDYKEVSMDRLIEIVKAEDELRFDKTLEDFMSHPNPLLRKRAALAAGRIGDDMAIPTLGRLLKQDTADVRQMAAFAIGEIESIKGADSILGVLKNHKDNVKVRARAVEAAGKITAANANDEKSKVLSSAILENLNFEARRQWASHNEVVLFGLTAVLRAKSEDPDKTLVKFLAHSNSRIRADTLNTLARLRSKEVNQKAKELLQKDNDAVVRAKAARILGAAKDNTATRLLTNAASGDPDLRVRVNAIRALSSLKSKDATGVLLTRAQKLFGDYKKSKYQNPPERNELLTISSAIGNILRGTNHKRAVEFLEEFRVAEKHRSAEVEVALVRVSPSAFAETSLPKNLDWRGTRGFVAGLNEAAGLEDKDSEDVRELRLMAKATLGLFIKNVILKKEKIDKSFPAVLSAYAKFETEDLQKYLIDFLIYEDVLVRSTAANLLGDIKPKTAPESRRIYRALSTALFQARTDKLNDASLSILSALEKQYKNRKIGGVKFPYMSPFISAMRSPDYLIRRRAAEIYKGFKIPKPDPMTVSNPDFKPFEIPKDIGIVKFTEGSTNGAKSRVFRADYKRALFRKNGKWGAILETEKGNIMIDLFPEDAPLTVDNFLKLAESGYFNGLEIHRVVPNFVVQDGDPRGDGSGGPGWQIRCEINQIPYERGMVGMALSGKDTGGSQWFVTHAPQPHLDGGYTVFGKVNENDMKIVDKLVRGDKILSVKPIIKVEER